MNRKPPPALAGLPYMTPWFGPKALAQTGLQAVTSQVILSQIDQRILQAAIDNVGSANLLARYDYSDPASLGVAAGQPVWVDYVADTGDGFESTYAIASMLATPHLDVDGVKEPLPAGRLLVMGGDQAYPFASDTEYDQRFLTAFNLTNWDQPDIGAPSPRKLFVLPGNHDWYDGLSAFERVFCTRRDGISAGRKIGLWQCQQHRSYWAVRLPYDWWIWGLDVQLNQSLDIGQIQYFYAVAKHMQQQVAVARKTNPAAPEPMIVMCIPSPSWYTGSEVGDTAAYSANLLKILNLAIDSGKVSAVLTGDYHHYSRYFSPEHRLNLFTAGGGGAYLAPTHDLPDQLRVPWVTTSGATPIVLPFTLKGPTSTDDAALAAAKREGRVPSAYPSARTSRWLSWQILLFPVFNPTFCMALGAIYVLLWWFYLGSDATLTKGLVAVLGEQAIEAVRTDNRPIIEGLLNQGKWLGLWEQLRLPFSAARANPTFAGTAALIFGLIWTLFAGAKGQAMRLVETFIFGACHIYAMTALAQVMQVYIAPLVFALVDENWSFLIKAGLMFVIGSGVAGALCGMYLFLGNRVFMTHVDTGFSAIRIANYKHFLRMKITPDELTVYPIAVKRVPRRWGWRASSAAERHAGVVAAYVPRTPLEPHLIEGPIRIRPQDIVDLQDSPAAAARAAPDTTPTRPREPAA